MQISAKMEPSIEDCPTGILIDVGETDVASLKCVTSTDIARSNLEYLGGIKHDFKAPDIQELAASLDKCLQTDRISHRNMKCVVKTGWMTPSPKSMKKISKEASRIIEKLYSSPLESSDLCDEECPILSSVDALDEVFEKPPKVDNEFEILTDDTIASEENKKIQVKATEVLNNSTMCDYVDVQDELTSTCTNGLKSEDCMKNPSFSATVKSRKTLNSFLKTLKPTCSKEKENLSQKNKKDALCGKSLFKCNNTGLSTKKNMLHETNVNKSSLHNKTLDFSVKDTRDKNLSEKRKSLSAHNISMKRLPVMTPSFKKTTSMATQLDSIKKSSLCQSASLVETKNSGNMIRRTSSFQTALVQKCDQVKEEKLSSASSHSVIMKSRMSINPSSNFRNKLITPLKCGTTSAKTPLASHSVTKPTSLNVKLEKSSRISRLSISSTTTCAKTAVKKSPPQSEFRKPMTSVSSRIRCSSRLDLPSPLPQRMSDNLARKLFF